jgi:hypothetical protein
MESALILTDREWSLLGNIVAYYLRTTPPNVLPEQRALAERVRDAAKE